MSRARTASAAQAHRADIQGLRALAVLLVALGHAGVPGFRGGFVGVDVFFVVSGFLITGILLAEARRTGSISLVAFYVRRARRILPAAALTLIAVDLVASVALNFVRARAAEIDSIWAGLFAANFHFAAAETDYFARSQPPSPLLHYWSLAVEEQFYLVWPALLAILTVCGRRVRPALPFVVLGLSAASLAWAVRLTATSPTAAYFSPLARAWELGLGAVLAFHVTRLARMTEPLRVVLGWTGIALVLASAAVCSPATPFPGYAALLPTAGTALVLAAGAGAARTRLSASRALGVAPLRYVGDRSYALYLWHWPVLVIAQLYAGQTLPLRVNLALLGLAFGLSIVSYAAVENPLRHVPWSGPRMLAAAATAVSIVLATAVTGLAAAGRAEARFEAPPSPAPQVLPRTPPTTASRTTATTPPRDLASPLPEVVAAVAAARRGAPIPRGLVPPISQLLDEPQAHLLGRGCVPIAASNETSSLVCRVGRTGSKRSIALVGDSHAQMWLPAVLHAARRDGWVVYPLLRPGCVPYTWSGPSATSLCRTWASWATAQVRRLHPTVALVSGNISQYSGGDAWRGVDATIAMAQVLRPAVRKVVVIGDPKGLRVNPLDCLLARRATMRDCTSYWRRNAMTPYAAVRAQSARRGFGFIETHGWFSVDRAFPAVIAHTIAYKDPHHITAAYALHLREPFRAAFRSAAR